MAREKGKKVKYGKLVVSTIFTIVIFVLLFFMLWKLSFVPKHEIFVSAENINQGDTILVKVSGQYLGVNGIFNNKKIDFIKNAGYSDWIAFLGVDTNTEPGKYKISVSVLGEKIEKEINVEGKSFSSVKMGITDKVIENITKNDNPVLNQIFEKFTPAAYFTGSFSFPLKNVQISGLDFGQFVKGAGYNLQHLGVDLRAALGTEIFAVNDGEVVLTKDMSNYGKTIVIDHGLGIYSLYLHLEEYKTSEGQLVKKGQVIGLSGNSGYSTAPHLHFSIRDNQARVNPLSFVKTTQKANEFINLASVREAILKIVGGN